MSTKFEKLLDYIINEEMDKANELFHEIVVEKSREIYENLIVQEVDEETKDTDDGTTDTDDGTTDTVDETTDTVDEESESLQYEDSYEMEADDDDTLDKTDDLEKDISINGDDEIPGEEEPSEDEAVMNIKAAIDELEAAFQDLKSARGDDDLDAFDDDEAGPTDMDADISKEMMGMVREYRETVAKPSGHVAGANTGEKMPPSNEGVSPISKGSGKPTTGAGPIKTKSDHANEDGTKPHGKVGGLVKQGGKFVGNNTHNVDNAKSGVKTLSKISQPAQGEGHAVGAGTGENSVKGATNTKSILKHM